MAITDIHGDIVHQFFIKGRKEGNAEAYAQSLLLQRFLPTRAIGIFDCSVWTQVLTASSAEENAQTADTIISGIP